MYEILDLKHVFYTFQETVWSHLNGNIIVALAALVSKSFQIIISDCQMNETL